MGRRVYSAGRWWPATKASQPYSVPRGCAWTLVCWPRCADPGGTPPVPPPPPLAAGYFCIAGGLGLGVGKDLSHLAGWLQLACSDCAVKLAATAVATGLMMAVSARCSHPAALPALLVAINAAFWGVVLAGGGSLTSMQEAGWVMQPEVGVDGWVWVGECGQGAVLGDEARGGSVARALCWGRWVGQRSLEWLLSCFRLAFYLCCLCRVLALAA